MKYEIEGYVQIDYFGVVEAESVHEAIKKVKNHEVELSKTFTHEIDIVSIREIEDEVEDVD